MILLATCVTLIIEAACYFLLARGLWFVFLDPWGEP